jgi:hypothetical protein
LRPRRHRERGAALAIGRDSLNVQEAGDAARLAEIDKRLAEINGMALHFLTGLSQSAGCRMCFVAGPEVTSRPLCPGDAPSSAIDAD